MPKNRIPNPLNPSKRVKKQIRRYGKPWGLLSDREKWYQRHKTRARGYPVNAYIKMPDAPSCYGNWEDDRCGVCGQSYESFNAGIDWNDGVESMLQAAKKERVGGGGYRSRGAVLYAMAVLKRQAFYFRHSMGCCLPVYELQELEMGDAFVFFPFPKIVWYLYNYGVQDNRGAKNIEQANIIHALINQSIQAGANKLSDFPQGLKEQIRDLEKKYQYSDWWRKMKRETGGTGIFFKDAGTLELEQLFPSSDDFDIDEGELPF